MGEITKSKNLIISLLFTTTSLLIFSCEKNSSGLSEKMKSNDSLAIINANLDTNSILNKESNSYLEMRKHKYPLPPISSINFINVNSLFDKWVVNNQFKESLYKVLKFYNKKYPDIDNYQTYYFTIHCYTDSTYKCLCTNEDLIFGLLILYEPNSKVANIFCVNYNLGDTEHHQMSYSFDNNSTIHLTESGMTDGGEDEKGNLITEDFMIADHKVIIKKNGEIIVETENKNQ